MSTPEPNSSDARTSVPRSGGAASRAPEMPARGMEAIGVQPAASVRPDVDDELLEIAFTQLPQSLAVMVAVIVLFGFVLWGTFSTQLTVGWIAVMSWVIAARYAMVLGYRRHKAAGMLANAGRHETSNWRRRFLLGAIASGAVWGGGAALAIAGEGHADLAVVIGAVLVVIIVSRLSLATQIYSQQAFLVAALVPPAVASWVFAGSTGRIVALILLVGVGLSIFASRRIYAAARALLEAQTELEATRQLAEAVRAKAQFWEMVEWAPDAINVTIDGTIRYANPACVRLYGCSHVSEIIGRGVLAAVHPASRAAVEMRLHELGGVGSDLPPIEIKCVRPNGEVFTVESRVRRITFDGQVANLVLQRDITARQNAEAAVAEYRERTQRLLKAASVGLWDWDIVSGTVYFSPEWKANLGYADHELQNEFGEWQSRVHPDDLAVVMEQIDAFRAGKLPAYEAEFRMRHRDGGWRWFLSRADIVRDAFGAAERMSGSLLDISERRRDQEALWESELRLRLAVRGADLGLWDVNFQTGKLVVNARWRSMLGLPVDGGDLHVDDWFARLHPDDKIRYEALRDEIFKNRSMVFFEEEFRVLHRDGSYRWILDRGAVVGRDEQGQPTRVCGTHMDITERKQAEATTQALEEQLRESQKMQAIGTLAGGIAHDFNNIIAAILGNADLAMRAAQSKPISAQLEQIQLAGRRGRDLVQQILSFSRRAPSQKTQTDIARVVDESAKMLTVTFPARVQLEVDCAQGLPCVMADATQIQQVIINLANNAMQAIGESTGRVRITLDRIDIGIGLVEGQPRNIGLRQMFDRHCASAVRISVRDTGEGMTPAVLERMFEPFFTTKAVDQGTGLGLSVVLGIVQAHEGAILVNSRFGEGTEFIVLLPVDEPSAASRRAVASVPREPAGSAAAPTFSSSPRANIMYVDDDEALVSLVEELLQTEGYRVSAFSNPIKALEAFRNSPASIDLVVTDFNMPGMSGIDLARALRALRPDIRIAIASGYVNDSLRRQAEEVKVAHLLPKVVAIESLSTEIAKILRS
jgi:PAS domain S-box-containing protein